MNINDLDTPAVLISVDVVERNLQRLADYCGQHDLKLRPHTKTHKIPKFAHRQLHHGAVGITVAKLGEAEVMADAGISDILIAYPLVGERKLQRLLALTSQAHVTVALDSMEIVAEISCAAVRAGQRIGVLAEFNTGFRRCGLPGLEWRGILAYPGQMMAFFHTGTRNNGWSLTPPGFGGGDAANGVMMSVADNSIRIAELNNGVIPHAIHMGMACEGDDGTATQIYPGSTATACTYHGPPAGARFVLTLTDAQINALSFAAWEKTTLHAMRDYGAYGTVTGAGPGIWIYTETTTQFTDYGDQWPGTSFNWSSPGNNGPLATRRRIGCPPVSIGQRTW